MSLEITPIEPSTFVVHGAVRRPSLANTAGPLVAGVKVQVYRQDIAAARLLEETTTDAAGAYSVTCPIEQFPRKNPASADALAITQVLLSAFNPPTQLVETAVDIWVGVPASDGKTYLARSSTYFNASGDLEIDLILPYTGSSELERYTHLILPRLRDVALDALTPGHVEFLSQDAVVGAEPIFALAAAAAFAKTTNHPDLLAAFYGLLRTQPKQTLVEILKGNESAWHTSLATAFKNNTLPATLNSQLGAWIKDLTELQAQQALAPTQGQKGAVTSAQTSLGDLLASLPAAVAISDPNQRLSIARLWMADSSRGDGFWKEVAASGISAAQAAALKTTVALNELAGGNLKLVQALQVLTPAEPDGTLRHLVALTANDWIQTAAQATVDTDSLTAIESQARDLRTAIESQFPSAALSAGLSSGALRIDPFPTAATVEFLAAHSSFDVKNTDIEPYLLDQKIDDSQLKGALLGVQRMLRLGATHDETAALLNAGFYSAHKIVALGQSVFVSRLENSISPPRLKAIFAGARLLTSSALGMASVLSTRFNSGSYQAIPAQSPVTQTLTRFPSLAGLFGDQSYCSCRHCNSVLGPAAYLVDLLRTLSLRGVEAALRSRRPDIARVELTCPNINIEMPYVDLVLEVLESAVTFPKGIVLTAAEMAKFDAGQAPATLITALSANVDSIDGDVSVLIDPPQNSTSGRAEFTLKNGARSWIGIRQPESFSCYGSTAAATLSTVVPIPAASTAAVLQALEQNTLDPSLQNLVAPEPRLPVEGPAVIKEISVGQTYGPLTVQIWTVILTRSVAVSFAVGGAVGAVLFKKIDGTAIDGVQFQPGNMVQGFAAALNSGTVPTFIAHLLPSLAYTVTYDAAGLRWILTAKQFIAVEFAPDQLVLTGMVYTASETGADLTVFPANRNPEAYDTLAGAEYPWTLPFDVFQEEVSACLATFGIPRARLLRTLRPSNRYRSIDGAVEGLETNPEQIARVTNANLNDAAVAALFGLQATGNILTDPSGDTGAPPIPTDFLGALSRLSVLLDRCRVPMLTLSAALWSTRYLKATTPAPTLDPPLECRPSRITVKDLHRDHLERLQRFLRLRLVLGWSIRDLDVALWAVTDAGAAGVDNAQILTLANLKELAGRLRLPARMASALVGPMDTATYHDVEAKGSPDLPSLYEEVFLNTQIGRTKDPDFSLNATGSELQYITAQTPPATLKSLSKKLTQLTTALNVTSAALAPLFTGASPLVTDELTLGNLQMLFQYATFARAQGLSLDELQFLLAASDKPPFSPATPALAVDERSARVLDFADLIRFVKGKGYTIDALAQCLDQPSPDPTADASRTMDRLQWLATIQPSLRAIAAPAETTEPVLRSAFAMAGWTAACVDRVMGLPEGVPVGLATVPVVAADVALGAAPAIPATLPFVVSPGLQTGHYTVTAILEMLAAFGPDAAFAALEQIAGLGPLTDATSPAAVLKTQWLALTVAISSIPAWLQSIEVPTFERALTFQLDVPLGLADPTIPAGLASTVTAGPAGKLTVSGFMSSAGAQMLTEWASTATNSAAFAQQTNSIVGPPVALLGANARLQYHPGSRSLELTGYLDSSEVGPLAALSARPEFAAAVQQLATDAGTFVELRPGQQLMAATAVNDLFLTGMTIQERYAAVHAAMVRPLRREVSGRLASARMGVDPRLFTALESYAQLTNPPFDVLSPLCAQDFLDSTIDPAAPPSAALKSATAIDRVGLMAGHLQLTAADAQWFDPGLKIPGLPACGFIPPSSANSTRPARMLAWRRTEEWFAVRNKLPGQSATLDAIRLAALQSLDAGLSAVETAFALIPGSALAVLRLDGLLTQGSDLLDPINLHYVVAAADVLRRSGAPASVLASLCGSPLSKSDTLAARSLLIAKFGSALGSDALRQSMNRLREKQRVSIVEYLIQRDGLQDSADLHARYLIDVEMGPEMLTSRLKQAIGSTQLFFQRWLMNLESSSLPAPPDDVAQEFEWSRDYRVWEANRKVFLYPENWLEPALRDDKSHLFEKFESELLQGEPTSDRALELLQNYLLSLSELGRLSIRAMYIDALQAAPNSIVHVVARTADPPWQFYYRQWELSGETSVVSHWTPWEPVGSVSDTDHVACFLLKGRPCIAWLQIGKSGDTSQSAGPGNWSVELLWSNRQNDGWSAPSKWRDKLLLPILINKDARYSFALRVEDLNGDPRPKIYGAFELGDPPTFLNPFALGDNVTPNDRQQGAGSTTQNLQIQVAGSYTFAEGVKYIALDEAQVEWWGYWMITYDYGGGQVYSHSVPGWPQNSSPATLTVSSGLAGVTRTVPIDLTADSIVASTAYIYVQTTLNGQSQILGPISLDPTKNNQIQCGFQYTIAPDDPRFSGQRPVRLLQIAAFDWDSSLGIEGGPPGDNSELEMPVDDAIHDSSGFSVLDDTDGHLIWRHAMMTDSFGATPFFVTASAGTNATVLGTPLYLEVAGAGGLITYGADGWNLYPSHDLAYPSALAAAGNSTGERLNIGDELSGVNLAQTYAQLRPMGGISTPFQTTDAQFDLPLIDSVYDWEIFFHIPVLVANALATNERFADALRWLHLVFDPSRLRAPAPWSSTPTYWRFLPFALAGQGTNIDTLMAELAAGQNNAGVSLLRAQIAFWTKSPFQPHAIARMRIRAYQWRTIFDYLSTLIAWGDRLFKQDTIEAINQATQLYLLAGELLGKRPTRMPEEPPILGAPTFAMLQFKLDDFSNAWTSLADLPIFQNLLQWIQWLEQNGYLSQGTSQLDLKQLESIGELVFCVPRNSQIDQFWDTVDDRLYKIRHSQNIDGVQRILPLFEPPLDPALLIRAVAAGLDIDSILHDIYAPQPCYRFAIALQKAVDFCNELKALGASLLSAYEKADAEALSRMRSTQEIAMLELAGAVKARQVDDVQASLTALRQSRESAEIKFRNFQRLMGKDQIQTPPEQVQYAIEVPRLQIATSTANLADAELRGYGLTLEESDQLGWMATGNTFSLIAGGFQMASGIAHALPDDTIGFNLGETDEVTFGGSYIGAALGAVGQFFSLLASNANFQASRSSIVAAHQRRYDEWIFQSNLANREMVQIDKQILASEIRVDIAQRELANHQKQIADSREIDDFLKSKFSKQELYQWMIDRLSEAHWTSYELAYDLAKRAERACFFELGGQPEGIVRFGSWDNLREGLLSGERLSIDLKQLEAAYLDRNRRELEITRHFALNDLDPMALLKLQATGVCEFAIPEMLCDMDFPGHYFRRIKTISVTIPCVAGPYTSVSGTLTLLGNSMRAKTSGAAYGPSGTNDERFVSDLVPIQSVATSSGQNDPGLFELNFRDERYLPFEGAGVISSWRFELPTDFRSFDYWTISDLIMHVRYTARDGGAELKAKASAYVRQTWQSLVAIGSQQLQLARAFSLRRDFPVEWHKLLGDSTANQTVVIDPRRLPYFLESENIVVWKVSVLVVRARGDSSTGPWVQLIPPAAAYSGTEAVPQLDLTLVSELGDAELYEADLSSGSWRNFTIGSTPASTAWQLMLPQAAASYRNVIMVLWWMLGAS